MGDELNERVEALEREARRLRRWVLVPAAALVGVVAVAATGPPQEMTLRKLTIVDGEGKPRIVLKTAPGFPHLDLTDDATLTLFDHTGKQRIELATTRQIAA